MAITFLNIRTKEIVVADSEPKIAAFYNSSDRSPNVNQGQDFGWRLAPEVVVQMRKIMKNNAIIGNIANKYQLSVGDVGEKEVLQYISDLTDNIDDAPVAEDGYYEDEYREAIKRLEVTETYKKK